MLTFKENEKSAIMGLLSAIIYSDGVIHTEELNYLARVKYGLDISDETMERGFNMDPADAFSLISAMSDDQKARVTQLLVRMIYSDKDIDDTEYDILVGVITKCDISLDVLAGELQVNRKREFAPVQA